MMAVSALRTNLISSRSDTTIIHRSPFTQLLYDTQMAFRRVLMAFFSNRDTCA